MNDAPVMKLVKAALFGALAFSTILGVRLALADTDPQGSPGWQYGGYHCGCYANVSATLQSCLACCAAAGNDPFNPLTPGQVSNCNAFCYQAVFPCIPPA